ncbi:hypothetical protein ACP70R_022615 [Stipagrostis hirtigluma subsp. patula]
MASIQCKRIDQTAVQRSFGKNASLDEIIKHAERSLESQEIVDKSLAVVAKNDGLPQPVFGWNQITVVTGTLCNQGNDKNIMDSHIWAGHIVNGFPNPLESLGFFTLSNKSVEGVEAGVVYSSENEAGVECGWLLAFADSKATGQRVYVECGRKNKFNNIKWGEVKKKLEKAGKTAQAYDAETGTSVNAGIRGFQAKSAVGASFNG